MQEERRKDAHDREAIVAYLKEQIRSGDKAWSAKATVAISKWKEAVSVIDEKQIKAEERYDSIWGLRTNTVCNAETVAHVYKAIWTGEDIFHK